MLFLKKIFYLTLFILGFSLIRPSGVLAQVCDYRPTQVINGCDQIGSTTKCNNVYSQFLTQLACTWDQGVCGTYIFTASCYFKQSPDGIARCYYDSGNQVWTACSNGGNSGGSCSGPTGGPCSGTCPSGQTCRAATVQNGAACGCRSGGTGGGCTTQTSECKQSCNPANTTGSCTRPNGNPGKQCTVCCRATVPTAPTLNSPVNGYSSPVANVTLSWSPPTSWGDDCSNNANKQFRVYFGADASTPYLLGAYASTQLSTTFSGTVGSTYYWRVIARNNQDWNETSSVVRNFRISGGVTGTVYYDANNACSTAVPWNQGAGMSVRLRGTAYTSTVTNGTGAYNISAPNASYGFMDLQGIPSGYTCSTACGQQCPTKTSVVSPSTGNNYFLTVTRESWWQVVGAPVYAGSLGGGNTVRSEMPSAATALILPGTGAGSSAVLLRATGTVDLGAGIVSANGWSTQSTHKGKVTDYNYFAASMGVVRGQDSDFLSDTLTLPSYDSSRDFYYSEPVSGTTTISSPITVGVGEKYVIFVNGNLDISSNITVPSGGFLAFIVKGNITVAPGVTSLQGIYLTSANFITTSAYVQGVINDVQLNVAGNVVAWGTFDLQRDLGTGNITNPAEKFTYRPDFMATMPKKMKGFAMQWQEVPAGTF